jgi:hypothetical protein
MKHAFIAPINYLDHIPKESDYHLILAHLLDDPKYIAFYKQKIAQGHFVILDNSAFEFGEPASIVKMAELCKKYNIWPNVVVAPDYPKAPGFNTVVSAINASNILGDYFPLGTGLMGVPQSERGDYKDFIRTTQQLSEIESVTMLGMSIIGVPNAFYGLTGTDDISVNRLYAMNYMADILNGLNPIIKIHLLGLGDDVREIQYQQKLGIAYGNDSSSAIWHGIQGIAYDSTHPHLLRNGKSRSHVDFNIEAGIGNEIIDLNIRCIESLINE